MKELINEVGNLYDRLIVISRAPNRGKHVAWNCMCSCGRSSVVRGDRLRGKYSKSCGCLQKETATSHGLSAHPLYVVWFSMKSRVLNPKDSSFHNYGGRGISICKEWLKFPPFYAWAKDKWKSGQDIDRENNDAGYEPDNCRFVTRSLNNVNCRKLERNTSGYTGVHFRKSDGVYQSYLDYLPLGGHVYLGYFSTPEDAVTARNNFIIKNNLPHKIQEKNDTGSNAVAG